MKEALNQPNLYSRPSYILGHGEFENLISVSGVERVWKSCAFVHNFAMLFTLNSFHNVVDENQIVAG